MTNSSSVRTATTLTKAGLSLAMALSLAGLCLNAAAAEYYRWKDEQGVVHYTDKPPLNIKAEKLKTNKSPPPSRSEPEAETEDEPSADSTKNPERCEMERKRLAVLQNNQQIRMRDDEGNLRDLSTKEIEEEIAFSKSSVERYCD